MKDEHDPDAATGCADDADWGGVSIEDLRRTKFAPTDPDGKLYDTVMMASWTGMVTWLMEQEQAHKDFAAATGRDPLSDRPATSDDDAFATVYAGEFARWATRVHWGEDEVTPSIRAALARFPRPH